MKKITLDVDELAVTPGSYKNGSYKKISIEFEAKESDILESFTIEEILQIKDPDISDILDGWSMEKILEHYHIDDIVQYCRDKRLEDLID